DPARRPRKRPFLGVLLPLRPLDRRRIGKPNGRSRGGPTPARRRPRAHARASRRRELRSTGARPAPRRALISVSRRPGAGRDPWQRWAPAFDGVTEEEDHELSHDIVIRGGTVIDGSGRPGEIADVAVRDGRIAAVRRSQPEN